jgi:osmoprotectant transport system substrate-binding protein
MPRRGRQPESERSGRLALAPPSVVKVCLSHRPRRARVLGAALAMLIVLALAGCSASSGSPPGGTDSDASTTSLPSTTSGTSTSTATATASLPGTGKPTVTIGDKNYTEQFLLGDLYRQALQAQGYSVELNQNIGPTSVTLQAIASGALDMYPEYLNTFDSSVAQYTHNFSTEAAAYAAARRYAQAHQMDLLVPTPFSDTPALGVTVGYAQSNHLRTMRDLARVASSLIIGGPPQFEQNHPGLPDLERSYDFTPAAYKELAFGDQYTALDAGEVQAADVNTTDGQLATGDYKVLSDPGNVLGWGNAVPVVAARVLNQEGPAFEDTISRISALLTVAVMRELNQAVDVAGEDPADVAKEFLETHGIIPPSS